MATVLRSLTPGFGAEIGEVLIEAEAAEETVYAVRALWHRHSLLLFRDQSPGERDLVEFSRKLGPLEIHVRTEFLDPAFPELLQISNIRQNGRSIGILSDSEVGWHYDQIYLQKPALGSLLCAFRIPPTGGNTWFADMSAAFEALPAETRERLDGLTAVQSYEAFNRVYSVPTSEEQRRRTPDIEHPLVRTHPFTGRKALYLCPGMTTRIVGLPEAESREILDELFAWTVRPEFVYEHVWRPGDCLMWDNACTMHRRDPFDPTETRLMKRTTILPPEELAVPF
jgi:taurine dioxygenase